MENEEANQEQREPMSLETTVSYDGPTPPSYVAEDIVITIGDAMLTLEFDVWAMNKVRLPRV